MIAWVGAAQIQHDGARTLSMSAGDLPKSVPKRILIVEDNELNMKLLNDVLEAYGYDIVKTDSGAAVLELARAHRPDLVLMDIQLPDVSGLDAARPLQGDPGTPAVPGIAGPALAIAGDVRLALGRRCE